MGLSYGLLMWSLLQTSLVTVASGLLALAPLSFPAMSFFMLAVAGTLGMTFRTVHSLLLAPMLMDNNSLTAPTPLAVLHADFGNGSTISSTINHERGGDVGKAPATLLAHIFQLAAKSSSSTPEPAPAEQAQSSHPVKPEAETVSSGPATATEPAEPGSSASDGSSACSDRSGAETMVFEPPLPACTRVGDDPVNKS